MGIFGKFFKKQSEPTKPEQQKTDTQVENIEAWIKSLNSEKINSVLSELNSVWKDLVSEIVRLQSSISVLEKAKFEPTDKTYAPINMIKDRFTTKSKLLNKIPRSIGDNFSSIKSAYNEASKLISEFKEADIKQAHVVSVYFKKEAEQIIKSLKTVDTLLSHFDKKLNSEGLVLQFVEDISNKSETIKQLKSSIIDLEGGKLGLEKDANDIKTVLEKQKSELAKINSDERWEELKKIKEEAVIVESGINQIEHSISEDISSISRPIKKILHESESSVKIELPENIEDIDLVYSAFNTVDNVLSKNKISLKETEIEKLDNIRKKIKSGALEQAKKSYESLVLRKRNIETSKAKVVVIEELKTQKEQEIKSAEALLTKLNTEAEKTNKDLLRAKDEIEKLKKEIKTVVVEEFNVELDIV